MVIFVKYTGTSDWYDLVLGDCTYKIPRKGGSYITCDHTDLTVLKNNSNITISSEEFNINKPGMVTVDDKIMFEPNMAKHLPLNVADGAQAETYDGIPYVKVAGKWRPIRSVGTRTITGVTNGLLFGSYATDDDYAISGGAE